MDPIDSIEDALTIDIPQADHLSLEDSRRLTGPGLLWDHPGAIVQIAYHDIPADRIAQKWHHHARRVLDAIGWQNEQIIERGFDGGHNLALSAPVDQLYSAIFAAETAWHFAASEILGKKPGNFDAMIADLTAVMAQEAHPALRALLQAGQMRGLDVLIDDDEVSIGHGTGSQTWLVSDLPAPGDVRWNRLHNAPVALITGTNGKTTTTRLCAAIARAAGMVSGLTSTDFVRVGDDVLDRGDYSGPGGARMLLRDKRLEVAFLEVARGGILRRGLPTRAAGVAVVTNVSADHLGQYGVNTVEELARAKFAVHRGLADDGVLVLNADDDYVLAEAAHTDATIWWFSLDSANPRVVQARASGTPCAWADAGQVIFFDGQDIHDVVHVRDVPITLAGAARHNIQNVLAAVCVAWAMGIDPAAIARGLSDFRGDPKDNPGRLNEFAVNGARVFVDFAHNPHSVAAVVDTVSDIPASRRFVLFSMAGDRTDPAIDEVTRSALGLNPDVIVPAEVPEYLRGRKEGEIGNMITAIARGQGMSQDQIIPASSPSQGVKVIIDMLKPGDLALLLILDERNAVFDLLRQAGQ